MISNKLTAQLGKAAAAKANFNIVAEIAQRPAALKQKKPTFPGRKAKPRNDKSLTFRHFMIVTYCTHGTRIGDTWCSNIAAEGCPRDLPLTLLQQTIVNVFRPVTSTGYYESSSAEQLIGMFLFAMGYGKERSISGAQARIIDDLWSEYEHALDILANNLVGRD